MPVISGVKYCLQPTSDHDSDTAQDSVTVVNATRDEYMHNAVQVVCWNWPTK